MAVASHARRDSTRRQLLFLSDQLSSRLVSSVVYSGQHSRPLGPAATASHTWVDIISFRFASLHGHPLHFAAIRKTCLQFAVETGRACVTRCCSNMQSLRLDPDMTTRYRILDWSAKCLDGRVVPPKWPQVLIACTIHLPVQGPGGRALLAVSGRSSPLSALETLATYITPFYITPS